MVITMDTTLARGLLMLSLRLMLLSSMELMGILDMLPLLMPMVPTLMLIAMDTTLARGLLMLSLRLMLLLTPVDTLVMLDTLMPMVPTLMPMVPTPTLDNQWTVRHYNHIHTELSIFI